MSFLKPAMLVYRKKTQNRAERPACIFISVGSQGIFNSAMQDNSSISWDEGEHCIAPTY